jgi:peptidoglycan/LPS O-acetylase OafA/YrhL
MALVATDGSVGGAGTVGAGREKLVHLQILRAVAATLVVVDHTFSGLNYRHMGFDRWAVAGDLMGYSGVAAFFVLSGLIMMRQSWQRFGGLKSCGDFWWHRVVRIAPMYWIATAVMVVQLAEWHSVVPDEGKQVVLSLFFVPNYLSTHFRLVPLLAQGWTLNYEMAFYLLFGIALVFRRWVGVAILGGMLVCGWWFGGRYGYGMGGLAGTLVRFYSDKMILLFALGVGIALLEFSFLRRVRIRFPVSPAFLLLIPAAVLALKPERYATWGMADWLGGLGALLVALCVLGGAQRMGGFGKAMVLLGDASYCTYLFHQFIYLDVYEKVGKLVRHFGIGTGWAAVLYVGTAVFFANVLGVVMHKVVEAPLTNAIRQVKPKEWPGAMVGWWQRVKSAVRSVGVARPPAANGAEGAGSGRTTLVHLQILRGIAATLVVVDHAYLAFDSRERLGGLYVHTGWLIGHLGVMAFFALSGFLMVRQSWGLFGKARNAGVFLWRRVIRIYPLYWIALGLTVWSLHLQVVHQRLEMLYSVLLVPNVVGGGQRLAPLLEPGWTLVYEMSFYLVVAACILLPRRWGVAGIVLVPHLAVGLHYMWALLSGGSEPVLVTFYAVRLVLPFAYGALIGGIVHGRNLEGRLSVPMSPALLLVVPALVFAVQPGGWQSRWMWDLLAAYGVLVMGLCAVAQNAGIGWMGRLLIRLGDASYSTYLFHLFLVTESYPLYELLVMDRSLPSPLLFAVFCVVLASAGGVVIHLALELPLTKLLRRIRFGSGMARRLEGLADTGSLGT